MKLTYESSQGYGFSVLVTRNPSNGTRRWGATVLDDGESDGYPLRQRLYWLGPVFAMIRTGRMVQ